MHTHMPNGNSRHQHPASSCVPRRTHGVRQQRPTQHEANACDSEHTVPVLCKVHHRLALGLVHFRLRVVRVIAVHTPNTRTRAALLTPRLRHTGLAIAVAGAWIDGVRYGAPHRSAFVSNSPRRFSGISTVCQDDSNAHLRLSQAVTRKPPMANALNSRAANMPVSKYAAAEPTWRCQRSPVAQTLSVASNCLWTTNHERQL